MSCMHDGRGLWSQQKRRHHQPYWAVRAHLQHAVCRIAEARASFDAAIRLTEDGAVRAFLEARRAATRRGAEQRSAPARTAPQTLTDVR